MQYQSALKGKLQVEQNCNDSYVETIPLVFMQYQSALKGKLQV